MKKSGQASRKPFGDDRTPPEASQRRPKKPSSTVMRIFICILVAGLTVLAYIQKQNELTELRLAIPAMAKEVKSIQEENIRLTYEIERFESPLHLMELARKPEFSHLKYPFLDDEIFLPQATSSGMVPCEEGGAG